MSIKYKLICEDDDKHKFEGWFPSIQDFEDQVASGQLVCPMCDGNVRRDIMAPNIKKKSTAKSKTRSKKTVESKTSEQLVMGGRARTLLKQLEDHVKKNFENVGKDFAKEARKAHKGERNEDFYGSATNNEAEELLDEGIDLFHVPEIKDN